MNSLTRHSKIYKIKVNVPLKGKWKVSMGKSHGKHRANANTAFSLIERRLLASRLNKKIEITVKYTNHTTNKTLASFNKNYLLYALSCFLEDYLSPNILKKYEKYCTEEY